VLQSDPDLPIADIKKKYRQVTLHWLCVRFKWHSHFYINQVLLLQGWKCSSLWRNSVFWKSSGVIFPNRV